VYGLVWLRVYWWVLVDTLRILRVPLKAEEFVEELRNS
jgi:hypothetical protein